ncbi:MAG: flagellin [Armatimonadia bacterium]
MRIGSRGYLEQIQSNVARPAERLTRLYGQLTSGKRLHVLSDDPLAASRAVRGHAVLEEIEARKFVIRQGQQVLGAADGALGDIAQSLSKVNNLALQASAPYLEESERKALAAEIRGLSDQMVTLGNMQVQDKYIFAGSQTQTRPLEKAEGVSLPVLYHGNSQAPVYAIDTLQQAGVGFTGQRVFNYADGSGERAVDGVDTDVFSLLEDLATAIEAGDTAQSETLREQVTKCHASVVGLRGQVGVMTQRYERALSVAEAADLRTRELLAEEEDVDFAKAASEMEQQETIYQAALGLTSRLLEMPDLFDMPW